MASTRSSLRTSRTTNEVVVAPRPAWKDPTEEIPTSAKFSGPAGVKYAINWTRKILPSYWTLN